MLDNRVTRFQYGVTNARETQLFSDMPLPDPLVLHQYLNDFDAYAAGDWTVTKVGTGTQALISGDGGLLSTVTTAGVADSVVTQKLPANFVMASGFRLWGRFIFSVDSIIANLILGNINVTATPFTGGQITDGIWLSVAGGAGAVAINAAVASTVVSAAGVATLVSGQYASFLYYWDGKVYGIPNGRVLYQLSGPGVTAVVRGELLPSAPFPGATITTPTFGIQNTSAVARTLNLDSLTVMQDRTNINASLVF